MVLSIIQFKLNVCVCVCVCVVCKVTNPESCSHERAHLTANRQNISTNMKNIYTDTQ